MRVFDLLAQSARQRPGDVAVSHHDRQITYRDLYRSSVAVARYLRKLGLAEGTRISILMDNSIEYVIAFLAAFRAGYVAVPLDTSLDADSLRFVTADCRAQVLFAGFRFRRVLPQILANGTTIKHVVSERSPGDLPDGISLDLMDDIINDHDSAGSEPDTLDSIPTEPNDTDLAAIFYTSGSTGKPKGVMLSHLNLVSNTLATVEYLKLTADDSVIVILPFYYIYGNSLLLTHLAVGGRLVIDNRFMYPEVVLDTMEQESVTGFSGVPSNFMILLANSTFAKRELGALRYFTQAGGAMAPEIVKKLMSAFPDKEIYIMYGQTEAAPRVTWLPPERLKEKLGSIGIPVPGVKVTVVDENDQPLPPGQVGEIVVDGPNVMMGYWNQADEQKDVLKDGRLYTGDMAKIDEDGYIYVVGRKKEIIKTGGNRVSAKEIEECLLEHDKVLEVAVFGVEDPILGEAIKAVIAIKSGHVAEPKEFSDHCRQRLAAHKVPKFVELRDSLPKQLSGKIDKVGLKNGK